MSVPLKELAGSDNQLTMVFRVTPEGHPDEAVYFSQHVPVPAIEEDAGGPAYLQGTFDVGEGKYHVDWMMRDRAERSAPSTGTSKRACRRRINRWRWTSLPTPCVRPTPSPSSRKLPVAARNSRKSR